MTLNSIEHKLASITKRLARLELLVTPRIDVSKTSWGQAMFKAWQRAVARERAKASRGSTGPAPSRPSRRRK
jgi:hypothetical protein